MNKNNFLILSVLALINLSTGLACSKGSDSYGNTPPPPPTGGSGATITISGMTFSPASKTVAKGAVVKWANGDSYAHTATSNDGTTFDSGNIAAGSSYSYTANTAGTFEYHCTIHGTMMSGTLVVKP